MGQRRDPPTAVSPCRIGIVSLFILLSVSTADSTLARAQETPLELTRLAGSLAIDGVPDEAAWRQVPPLPLTVYSPVFRGEPTEPSEIRIAYDDENLYAAGWFYDRAPPSIRVNSLYRDRISGDDQFVLYIDTFNDNQNAKSFATTPAGIRVDQLVSDDGATKNEAWDTFWTAATSMSDEGWFAEIRIPFSSLGFRTDAEGRVVMGLSASRLIARNQERITFPEIDPKFDFRRPSLARKVVLTDVRSRRPLYVTPYALGGTARSTVVADEGGYRRESDASHNVGLDVRYPLSGTLTLDLTTNTDFAQVEADEEQVALDRFPLFYPERRRFFQEGSGVFDYTTAGGGRLFHSRRIGLTPDGEPVTILGGARLVGRAGGWDVGLLEVQTAREGTTPAENFGVFRMRRAVLNPSSTAGFMMTSYAGGGRTNVALGADTSLRLRGDDYITLKWASTLDSTDPNGVDLLSRSLFDARWERRTGRGLSYAWTLSRAGDAYRPEQGFTPRRDYTTANVVANWFFFTDENRFFRRVYPGALAFQTFRNTDGALESAQWAVWVQWDTKGGGGGWVEPKRFHENVVAPFKIGGAVDVPAGAYDFADVQVHYSMDAGSKARTDVDFRAGTYFDGRRTQVILSPVWNVSRHLELGADYQLTALRFPVRHQLANIQLLGLRVRTALDAKASGNALIQYNSTTGRIDCNVRLRYNFSEGTDLWLVYNEGLAAERMRRAGEETIEGPLSLARAFVIKYTRTFTF
jgi:hypothetical protein